MKLPGRILRTLRRYGHQVATRRAPDFVIGTPEDAYLRRWWLIPRNPLLNIYLHEFRRSDDDRAHHDHPWCSLSIILQGGYLEHRTLRDGSQDSVLRTEGAMIARTARAAHRVELLPAPAVGCVTTAMGSRLVHLHGHVQPAWTLFITGPRIRQWGFLCPNGWRHWRDFTNPATGGATTGRGCE